MSPARFLRPVIALAVATALTAGCGAVSHAPGGSRDPAVVARDGSNGKTIHLDIGDRVSVILGSTYWTLGGSSAPAVLRQDGPARVHGTLHNCVPGQGCGSLRALFAALAHGTAVITAHRVSCGEALLCTGSRGYFRLTVIVG